MTLVKFLELFRIFGSVFSAALYYLLAARPTPRSQKPPMDKGE